MRLMSAIGFFVPCAPAFAQYLEPPEPRFPRDRNIDAGDGTVPGLEAPGVRLGPFTLHPSIAGAAIYSDNIYAQETSKADDVAVRIAPSLKLQSNWPVNRLSLNLAAQFDRFAKLSSEDADRFDADASTLLEVGQGTVIRSRLRWQRLQEPRSSQNAFVQTRVPLKYDMTSSSIGISHDLNRVRLVGEATALKTNYFNGQLLDGTALDSTGRDNTTLILRGRVEYAQMPGLSYLVQGTYNERNFRAGGGLRPSRDSKGYEILAGVSFEPSALMRGEIGVGFINQNFASPFYNDNSNLGMRGKLAYFPTRLTTISIEADRRVEDTGTPLSGAYLSTSFALKAEHALLRSLIVAASVEYHTDRFNDIDRDDDRYAFGINAEYRLNRALAVKASATHLNVSSAGIDRYRNYSENRLLAGISLRR